MKLNELLVKPLNEVLKDTNITSMKPISDESGNLIKIIIEYEPKGGAR